MGFVLGTLGIIIFLVGVLLLVGHFNERSNRELIDWKPTRSTEVEAQNEIDDVQQMLDAQNQMRRRRGAPELEEGRLREEVEEEELDKLRRGDPFGSE